MNVALICFTQKGKILADKVAARLREEEYRVTVDVKCTGIPEATDLTLSDWTRQQFESQDALIFIGATGIAVRAIAPYVRSKQKDPAVLVIDEMGIHCIPLLSGHIGGANELALLVSEKIQALPVITTATDINQKWAVDVFAVKNGLQIQDMKRAKRISADILKETPVLIDFQGNEKNVEGKLPRGLVLWNPIEDQGKNEPDISVGIYRNPAWSQTLYLIPKVVVAGIGCRRHTEAEQIELAVTNVLRQNHIWPESIWQAASIDIKANEPGILEYCLAHRLQFQVYSSKELQEVKGDFTSSGFVERVTGVDNVCERSALCASESGQLIVKKQAGNGVTVALAVKEWRISFE
ncbi:cobalt-precorrin 5A hydrolase [Blautia obeum]|uniref:cobalt-precorrin 5A hydrolase n=1 Tax=Blautia obeum TaxID=40520 RepID=UPI003049CDFC|nr:cobalt-precorrin 5A hydrolase [Lachnospiraceae bacterium]MCI6534088.1 cobalt-precorrin 5A hydrolase [Lachnospiraceae bacterium]